MLAVLAMKKRWQNKMKAAGKDIHKPGPNIVMGSNVQVCWEKGQSCQKVRGVSKAELS